ncbi:uncharacterized protein LOC144175150 isoform X2 [Haemaphysalis longicornis]
MSTDRDDVEAVIGSILATEREGLSLQRLDGEYRSIVGYQIPFGRLGHTSLTAFLKSIPNVVALHRHLDGTVTAYGAHNAATAHVTKLVAQQKPSKNRRGAGPMRGRQSQHAQRPCHWQVHPYRKTGQQNRNNWNAQGAQRTNYQVGANNPPALAPKGGPKASARAPLRELPSNFQIQGNPLSTNTPARHQGFQPCPGRPFATSSEQELGIQRPDLRTWLTFLAGTGLAAFKVPIYAEMLLRQGVDPGCLWLFTAQDIRRMGIVDAQDVRLLQDRAHAVRTVLGPAAADNPLGDPPCGAPSERWQGNVHVGNVNQWPEQPNQRSEREPGVVGGRPAAFDPTSEAFARFEDQARPAGHSSAPDLCGGTSVSEGEARLAVLNMAAWHLAQSSFLMSRLNNKP